jgi:glycosyltransferase involved in cell wall biosynthesis
MGDTLRRAGVASSRVSTILNGIDHHAWRRDGTREPGARSAFGVEPDAFVVAAVGRLEQQKRFDVLLDAFEKRWRTRQNLRLLVAGEGECRRGLEAMAADRGLAGVCRFLGHCHDVATFHHTADLFVQSSDYEGTSNALLEAMALETPVVATNVGGTSELITHGVHGLLVPPRDPAALADAIEYTVADRAATARRVAAARARVEHELSFDARMASIESVYEELIRCA